MMVRNANANKSKNKITQKPHTKPKILENNDWDITQINSKSNNLAEKQPVANPKISEEKQIVQHPDHKTNLVLTKSANSNTKKNISKSVDYPPYEKMEDKKKEKEPKKSIIEPNSTHSRKFVNNLQLNNVQLNNELLADIQKKTTSKTTKDGLSQPKSEILNKSLTSFRSKPADEVVYNLNKTKKEYISVKRQLNEIKKDQLKEEQEAALLRNKLITSEIKNSLDEGYSNYLNDKKSTIEIAKARHIGDKQAVMAIKNERKKEIFLENKSKVDNIRSYEKQIIENFRNITYKSKKSESVEFKSLNTNLKSKANINRRMSLDNKRSLALVGYNEDKLCKVKRNDYLANKLKRFTNSMLDDIEKIEYEKNLCSKFKQQILKKSYSIQSLRSTKRKSSEVEYVNEEEVFGFNQSKGFDDKKNKAKKP